MRNGEEEGKRRVILGALGEYRSPFFATEELGMGCWLTTTFFDWGSRTFEDHVKYEGPGQAAFQAP